MPLTVRTKVEHLKEGLSVEYYLTEYTWVSEYPIPKEADDQYHFKLKENPTLMK